MRRVSEMWNRVSERLDRWDFLILFLIVLGYGIFSFWNLGSTKSPQTFYTFQNSNDEIIIELLKGEEYVTHVRYFVGEHPGMYNISISSDGEIYTMLPTESEKYVFTWNDIEIKERTKYIKIESVEEGSQIGEIQVYQSQNPLLTKVTGTDKLTDEKNTVPMEISYMNSAYFDEVYFARTAYDYANGLPAYEWVHPPLGKLIQAIPVSLFGMSPFTFRMMGNISGILLIVVMYCFAKNMFHHRSYALLAASFMMFDNFHFAQSRMGTVDTHLVLFILLSYWMMYRYIKLKDEDSFQRKLRTLFLCGLFISCAIATKWTGLFAGLGLAIIFFIRLYQTYRKKKWDKEGTQTIIFCCFVFVLLPLCIYIGSYFLFPKVSGHYVNNFSSLIDITQEVFEYHSSLKETHPFSSPWYTWPVIARPVWYYANTTGPHYQTISGIGNPLVWWGGIIALLAYVMHYIKERKKEIPVCLIAIGCLFFSYIPITRDMFLYHYFPVLPFIMLLLVWFVQKIQQITKSRAILTTVLLCTILLFVYFYPVSSGANITQDVAKDRRWFESWYF